MPAPPHVYFTLAGEVVASFPLTQSVHTAGAGEAADLVLPRRIAPPVICRFETTFDGLVTAVEAGGPPIRGPAGGAGARQPLPAGGFVDVGDFRVTLLRHAESPAPVLRQAAVAAPPTERAEGILAPGGEPMSLEIEEAGRRQRVDLDPARTLLAGRGSREPEPGIDFLELFHPLVSRTHCLFRHGPEGWTVVDRGDDGKGSTNGTGVNAAFLRGGELRLEPGDLVRLPPVEGAPTALLRPRRDAIARPRGERRPSEMVGRSDEMRRVLAQIDRVAQADEPVCIFGETGTGKELVARALHAGRTPDKPFVPVNCGAIPESLIEGELFGWEKGAFTGAVARRQGPFEVAAGGTVFLDEIGELPLFAQVKLLRVLQERKVQRLGGSDWIPIWCRLVCATHRDLARMAAGGRFREDLYHRIHVLEVNLPPLRERPGDVRAIARAFAARKQRQLTETAVDMLEAQAWPGNVRQLENVLKRSFAEAGDKLLLDASDIELHTEAERRSMAAIEAEARRADAGAGFVPKTLDELDLAKQKIVEAALTKTNRNGAAAARALGIPERTLRNWCRRWKLAV